MRKNKQRLTGALLGTLAGIVGLFSNFLAGQEPPGGEITSFQQAYELPLDRASKGIPLRIKGQILCYDWDWNQVHVHDGRGVTWISPGMLDRKVSVGEVVEITGQTVVAQNQLSWTNLRAKVDGRRELPPATRVALAQLPSKPGEWVEIEGEVRVSETSRGRLGMVVHDSGTSCVAYVLSMPGTNQFRDLMGCKVRLRGVSLAQSEPGEAKPTTLMVPNMAEVAVLQHPSQSPLDGPVVAIESFLSRELGAWTNLPIHLNGIVVEHRPGDSLTIKDPTGRVQAKVLQVSALEADDRVNLWGFLAVTPKGVYLRDAYFEPITRGEETPALAPAQATVSTQNTGGSPLTRISRVNRLGRAGAQQRYPVRLEGVVTYADPEWRNGFLQDGSGAIYFDLGSTNVRSGDAVVLTGVTDQGGFAPQISETSVQVLGPTNLPRAVKVDLEDLAGGHFDSQWVEMEGAVRRVHWQWDHVHLQIMTPKGTFRAVLPGIKQSQIPGHLYDASVSVRGACSTETTKKQQARGIVLHVPSLEAIQVLDPAPADPFALPAIPSDSINTFKPDAPIGRRVKLSGVITMRLPGEGFVLQDSAGAIRVHISETNQFQTGHQVEVVGFPAMGGFSPRLEDAVMRDLGPGQALKPQRTSAESILNGGADEALLVELEAELLQRVPNAARPRLVLQDGPIIFTAHLVSESASPALLALKPGSRLQLSGICSIQAAGERGAESFRLLLGSAQDVRLLSAPAVWSVRRTLLLVGALAVPGLLVVGWVVSLRKEVQRQTEALSREKNLLATLIDHLPDNVFVKDLAGRYLLTNHAHSRFHGADCPTFFKGKLPGEILPDDLARLYAEADRQILEGKIECFSGEEPAKNGRGEERCLATIKVPLKNEEGSIVGLVGICRDVTERKQAEQVIREKERALSALMSNLPGMAYRCRNDQNWTMEFLSEGCFELTGYRPAELLGNKKVSYSELIHEQDRQRVWNTVQEALAKDHKYQIIYRIRTASGEEKWVWEQGLGVYGPSHELTGLEGFIADITERKRAEQRLSAFSTLGQQLSAAQSAKAAAQIIVEVADDLLGWDACFCQLYSSERDAVSTLLAMDLLDGQRREVAGPSKNPRPSSLFRRVLQEGSLLVLRNPSDQPPEAGERFGNPERVSMSLMYVPIQNGKNTIGILSIQSYRCAAYDEASLETLQALANFCGGALDRIQAEEELQNSERLIRSLVECLPQCILRKDAAGRFTFANEYFCRLLGRPIAEIIGKTDLDLYPQELAIKFRHDDQLVMASGQLFRTVEENLAPDGKRTFVEVIKTPLFDSNQQPLGLQVVFWDITERRQAEIQLAYERDLLTTLLDKLPDALYFKDLQSRFVRVSKYKLEKCYAAALERHRHHSAGADGAPLPAHLRTLEAFAAYLPGTTDFDYFEEARARSAFNDELEIMRTGVPIIGKVERAENPSGQQAWSLTTKLPWHDREGRLIGTFGVSKDITAIKDAEAKLEAAHEQLMATSRQAGMAEVATGVLHNVGNVLNSVNVSVTLLGDRLRHSKLPNLGKAAALLRGHEANLAVFLQSDTRGRQLPSYLEQLAEHLGAEQTALLSEVASLAKNVEHIKTIVAMQQSYAKVAGIFEAVQPVDLVEDALRLNGSSLARHHIQVHREFAPGLPPITVDKHKTLQILVNLISNAKYACDAAQNEEKQVTIRVTNGADLIRFSVSDNGVGIAPENLNRVFNLGFTTRRGGHGFGLHSGALAAKEMGGKLASQSDGLGRGATFILELPLAPRP